jgi:AcrR family transcriptional regulator
LTLAQRPLTTARAKERRAQLIGIALELFLANDYDDVSVDDVAAVAGVSHGLVFQYFGSKKGLYLATLEPLLTGFRGRTRGAPPDLPPADRLRHAIGAYFDAANEHPASYRSVMAGGAGFREVFDRIEAARWGGLGLIASTAGLDLERPDVRVALRGWVGFLEGAILATLDRSGADRDYVIEVGMSVFAAAVATLDFEPQG